MGDKAANSNRISRRQQAVCGAAALLVFGFLAPTDIDRGVPEPRGRVERAVVLVSIDGLAPRYAAEARTPTLDRLAREGASALHARSVLPPITLPAHTSMLTGLSVEAHGVRWNRYVPWRRIEARTLFDVCAELRLACGLFAGKRKFAHFAEGRPGVARYAFREDAAAVLAAALGFLEQFSPDFVAIHLAEVDLAGHASGWGNESQLAAIEQTDAELGRFVAALTAGSRPTALIVTADHGGEGRTHGRDTPEDRHVPWIAWGDGVPAGAVLDEVSLEQTAPAVLSLLGVEGRLDGDARAPF